jgi:hypothetical protein
VDINEDKLCHLQGSQIPAQKGPVIIIIKIIIIIIITFTFHIQTIGKIMNKLYPYLTIVAHTL